MCGPDCGVQPHRQGLAGILFGRTDTPRQALGVHGDARTRGEDGDGLLEAGAQLARQGATVRDAILQVDLAQLAREFLRRADPLLDQEALHGLGRQGQLP